MFDEAGKHSRCQNFNKTIKCEVSTCNVFLYLSACLCIFLKYMIEREMKENKSMETEIDKGKNSVREKKRQDQREERGRDGEKVKQKGHRGRHRGTGRGEVV